MISEIAPFVGVARSGTDSHPQIWDNAVNSVDGSSRQDLDTILTLKCCSCGPKHGLKDSLRCHNLNKQGSVEQEAA
jgi:hypothetical protein